MAPKVQTPVKGFTGVVAGVSFADGEGETSDPSALAYFDRHGYKVAGSSGNSSAEGKELTPKQKAQVEAKSLGLSDSGTKDEIEARIAEHKKQAEDPPADGETGANGENPPAPAGAAGEDVS